MGLSERLAEGEPAGWAANFHVEVTAREVGAGNRCECCGCRGGRLEIHHLKAVSDGGGNTLEDLRVLCKPCHALIHKMDFELRADWFRARELALQGRRRPTQGQDSS